MYMAKYAKPRNTKYTAKKKKPSVAANKTAIAKLQTKVSMGVELYVFKRPFTSYTIYSAAPTVAGGQFGGTLVPLNDFALYTEPVFQSLKEGTLNTLNDLLALKQTLWMRSVGIHLSFSVGNDVNDLFYLTWFIVKLKKNYALELLSESEDTGGLQLTTADMKENKAFVTYGLNATDKNDAFSTFYLNKQLFTIIAKGRRMIGAQGRHTVAESNPRISNQGDPTLGLVPTAVDATMTNHYETTRISDMQFQKYVKIKSRRKLSAYTGSTGKTLFKQIPPEDRMYLIAGCDHGAGNYHVTMGLGAICTVESH